MDKPSYLDAEMRKAEAALVLLLIVLLMITALSSVELTTLAEANAFPEVNPFPGQETVPVEHGYITSDGTVEPKTLPIQRKGNQYILQDNIINYSLEVHKDNVMLDGNGFSLSLPPSVRTNYIYGRTGDPLIYITASDPLIYIADRTNIIIKNLTARNYFTGIYVQKSTNITVMQNALTEGSTSIYVTQSANCNIIGNEMLSSDCGFQIRDSTLVNIAYNSISFNHDYGGIVGNLSSSNITRNDFTGNSRTATPAMGLYIYMQDKNNRIFENNFISNDIGLVYGVMGADGAETIIHNYWSNNSVVDVHGATDFSPLQSPIDTFFDPSLFPLPFLLPEATPQNVTEPFYVITALEIAAIAIASSILGLIYILRKHKNSNKVHT
jgi:parallel beta-helix repeat protein